MELCFKVLLTFGLHFIFKFATTVDPFYHTWPCQLYMNSIHSNGGKLSKMREDLEESLVWVGAGCYISTIVCFLPFSLGSCPASCLVTLLVESNSIKYDLDGRNAATRNYRTCLTDNENLSSCVRTVSHFSHFLTWHENIENNMNTNLSSVSRQESLTKELKKFYF